MSGDDNKRAVAELEFIDIFRVCEGRLIEHWTSMDIAALRRQMRP